MKSKKHTDITSEFEKAKRKQLEKLATKMLKTDDEANKLKSKPISKQFLDLF